MSWFTDANCASEALKAHCAIAYAVDLDFPSGHVRLHTWTGDLSVNGQTYTGTGSMGSISKVPDHTRLTAERWDYTLSGVDPSTVPESEIDNCFGRSVTEYEVFLNPETRAVIGFEIRRDGQMGHVRRVDGASPTIQVNCETRLVFLERADSYRYTKQHQIQFFASDTGLDQVEELESIEILWGGHRVQGGVIPTIADRLMNR